MQAERRDEIRREVRMVLDDQKNRLVYVIGLCSIIDELLDETSRVEQDIEHSS